MLTFRLGSLRFELDAETLRAEGAAVPLGPTPARLLAYLASNRDRTVPTEELLREVWNGVCVTPASVQQAVHALRSALGEGSGRDLIRTVRGRGYQLGPHVEVEEAHEWSDPHRLPLLGRAVVLGRLTGSLEHARAGRGRIVMLSGPAGIGKTRLLEELAAVAQRRGFQVCRGGAPQDDADLPLWPWEQILQGLLSGGVDALATLPEPERRALRDGFPSLGGDASARLELEAGAARARLFEAVRHVLANAARQRPLVIALDDLHRADPMSLRLLEWIAAKLSGVALLAIAAHRDATARGFDQSATRLLASPDAAQEALGPLSREDVAEAVRLLNPGAASSASVEAVWRRSGGNPLFLRAVLLSGALQTQGRSSQAHAAVHAHLSSLTPGAYRTLRTASVLGLEVERALALGIGEEPADAWDRHLEEAHALQLVRPQAGGWVFSHALVWEALHVQLSPDERIDLHARVAALLEQRQVRGHAELVALADHACRAVPRVPAAAAAARCVEAAESSARRLAFEEADRLYSRALELSARAPDPDRLALLVSLAENRARLGDLGGVMGILEPAAELATRLGDGRGHARLALAVLTARGDSSDHPEPTIIAILERALAAQAEPTPERALLLSSLAQYLWFVPPRERARKVAEEAVELARRSGDPAALADALIRAHRVLQTGVDDDAVRARIAAELEEIVEGVPESLRKLEAQLTLLWESLMRGDRAGVDHWAVRMEQEARAAGGPHAQWWALVARASRAHLVGELAAAEALAEEALALPCIGLSFRVPNYVLQMLSIRPDQGRLGEVEPLMRQGLEDSPLRLPREIAWRLAGLANGRRGPARELLRRLRAEGFRQVTRDVARLDTLAMLTDMIEALGDRDAAQIAFECLRPARHRHVVRAMGFCHLGSVAHHLGRLCEVLEDSEEAERWYAEGLERDRRLGALPFVARGLVGLGRVLYRRSDATREHGLRLLDEGVGLARDLGMTWLADRAAAVGARATSPRALHSPRRSRRKAQ